MYYNSLNCVTKIIAFLNAELMKNLYKALFFLCFSSTLFNCTKEDTISADVEINDFVWKAMNAYYLYQDQIPDLADRRFNNQPELNNFLREEIFSTQ